MISIIDQLKGRHRNVYMTYTLMAINIAVFIALLYSGAGFFKTSHVIQLAWGVNFEPATQEGEWWRLGTAMFLHFGIFHLAVNTLALWDIGQFTERMYGSWRMLIIYIASGLFGNLLSIVMEGEPSYSSGASGAILGIFAALIIFLWRERHYFDPKEFKWFFGGAIGFLCLVIITGYLLPNINNAAHLGGFIAGIFTGIILAKPMNARTMPMRYSLLTAFASIVAVTLLITNIPPPKYKLSEELALKSTINLISYRDQQIYKNWLDIQHQSRQGNLSFEELAGKIDDTVLKPYENSFEMLSQLPENPHLPSAQSLENWLIITEQKKNNAEALAAQLRKNTSP